MKMGLRSGDNEDAKDWSDKNEIAFLRILHERVKLEANNEPNFKPSDWKDMDEKLFLEVGERYGPDKVKGKYNRLRIKHRLFSDLLEHTGVTYDLNSNTVFATQDVWEMFYKKNKMYKSFKKCGCKNYQLLGQVYNKSTVTELLHHASTQLPPIFDEECENEGTFLNNDIHQASESETESSKGKRLAEDFFPGFTHVNKKNKFEKLDSCLHMCASSRETRAQKDLGNADTYEEKPSTKVTNLSSYPYAIENCMNLLESMGGVSDKSYNNTLKKFKDVDWRTMFIKMSNTRRKTWVDSLEFSWG